MRRLSAYVHVPYCLRRCGYCDFNTYTNLSLGSGVDGFAAAVATEIRLAAANISASVPNCEGAGGEPSYRQLDTVFFGGGTPTVLPATDLVAIVEHLRETFGISSGAEITTEANPDSVDAAYLEQLAGAGFTRISFGMQSAVPHVLRTLERTHTQTRLEAAIKSAHDLGLRTSVDLIYGTPGESLLDWQHSVEEALALGVKHISCYALVIEENTAMGRALREGRFPAIDPDEQADKYELADELLTSAGLPWYEISNWAAPGHQCRHNLNYWMNQDWLGFGPGAHSHLHETRFWNLKSPVKWASVLASLHEAPAAVSIHGDAPSWLRQQPLEGFESLNAESAWLETVLLQIRLSTGLDLVSYANEHPGLVAAAQKLATAGLLQPGPLGSATAPNAVLTRRGRLLADTVTHALSYSE